MFDKTIDKMMGQFEVKANRITDDISIRLEGVTNILKYQMDGIRNEFMELSESVKTVIYICVGLSIVDTILLFAILKKLG